jgi:hypothetical protein
MRVISILLVTLLLTGCVTTKEVIRYETKEVKVPIPIKCETPIPEVPDFNFPKLKEEDTIFDKVKALLADRNLHLGYEEQLLTALQSCK